MKVVLAEFDKGLMLKRKKGNYFLGICPKYPEKILKADETLPKISWKDSGADGKVPKIS